MEAAENGVLSLGEIFSNEDMVSDSDHLPEGPWVPSDAREAQRISGKSVTSPRQGMVSQACSRRRTKLCQASATSDNVDWGPRQRTPSEFRGRTERGESGRVATHPPLGLPLELSLRLRVPASSRALCALTSPGVNILASGMLFSGQRVSELRCERQVAYVLRRLGGSERSTELARSTPTAVSLTTQTSTRTTQTMVLTIIKNKRGRFDGLDTKDKKAAADALSLKTDSLAVW